MKTQALNDSINLVALTLVRSAKWMNCEWKKKIASFVKNCRTAQNDVEKEFLVVSGNEMLSDVATLMKSML